MKDRTGLILPPKRRRGKRIFAHFKVYARMGRGRPMRATVTIDRAPGAVVTIRKHHSRRTWQMSLATLVELVIARLQREEAERELGIRTRPGEVSE